MLRFIIREECMGHIVYGGASKADVIYKTIDLNIPELEKLLQTDQSYTTVQLQGVEIIKDELKAVE